MRVYVIGYVPVASRAAAETAVRPYLLGDGAVWAVPLSATGAAPATHYGLCAPVDDAGELYAALPALKAMFAGGDYHTVAVGEYTRATHWVGWLLARSLRPVTGGA